MSLSAIGENKILKKISELKEYGLALEDRYINRKLQL